ncbi:hypothetical protein Tco_0903848, partial [Tanacetum coccineum]
CVLRIFGLYTSRLLDAACTSALKLLKKGLLVRGEAKGDYRDGLQIDVMDRMTFQNWRDLPRDIPLDSVVVLRYEKRSKSKNKGKVPAEMELVLEQTQQGTSYEVSISTEGVEELKRKVKIKGEKKESPLILRQKLRNDHEFEEYLILMTVLCEISTSQSQENVHANQNDLIPPGVENDDSEDEVNKLPNLDHQDDPSIPRPPPEPPDVDKCFEPEAGILITKVFKGVSKSHDFMTNILPTLPTLVSDLTFILFLSSFLSFGSEDTVIDPTISEDSHFRCCTDKTKITRKPSKTGKHGHKEQKSTKEAGD